MPELMTLPELAEYLRFTRKTIYGLLKQGGIPAIRIGRKWRFDKDVIDVWLNQNTKGIKANILVIDDDYIIRSLFEATLKDNGHTIMTASNGNDGIHHIETKEFDLVFLDLKLPDTDGAAVFREIRRIKPNSIVIIITAYPDSEMMDRALKEGPFGILKKPFNDSDIINTVNSFLRVTSPKK